MGCGVLSRTSVGVSRQVSHPFGLFRANTPSFGLAAGESAAAEVLAPPHGGPGWAPWWRTQVVAFGEQGCNVGGE